MITPEAMRKLNIIGPKSALKTTIETLYALNTYHIQDHSKDEHFDIGTPLENATRLSENLVRVRSLISHLNVQPIKNGKLAVSIALLDIESKTKKLAEQVNALVEQKRHQESQLAQLSSKISKLNLLKTSSIPLEAFFLLKSMRSFVGFVQKDCRKQLQELSSNVIYGTHYIDGKIFCVVFIETAKAPQAENILSDSGFSALDMKELQGLKGTAEAVIKDIQKQQTSLQLSLAKNTQTMRQWANQHRSMLLSAEAKLSEDLKKAQAPLRFGSTKQLFMVSGWVPKKQEHQAIHTLLAATKEKLHIETAKPIPGHDTNVPTKLSNPKPIHSFESLLQLFSWPKYGEIDPSFLMFFTLPLFFGMMLGDIGYGLISLVAFSILRLKMPQFKLFLNVLIIASLSAIFFGFLFGEIFGLEEIAGHHLWHVLSRAHDITTLMAISFIIGLVHVNLGLVLGFINEWRMHSLWHAITHKVSWMLIQVSGALWFMHVSGMTLAGLPAFWPAAMMSVLALGLLIAGEGLMGIVELPSIISNIVSYARIMAVGLASVFLAILINNTASGLFEMGMVWFIFLGIPLIIIGHGFNLALGIFSPFLHSVRLHYVEFFTKFYQGGGKEFVPFGADTK